VVYTGDLPKPSDSTANPAHATAADHEPELAAVPGQLDTTPSLLEAAAAGIISLPADAPPGFIDQQLQQQGLPLGFGALPAGDAAAAGPFATQQAALAAAAGDGSFSSSSQGLAGNAFASGFGGSFVSQGSVGSLLSQASSCRLLQPLSAAQVCLTAVSDCCV
jgi:hypothetical protein